MTAASLARPSAAILPFRRLGVMRVNKDGWGVLMRAAQAGDAAAYRLLLGDLRDWLERYYRRRVPPSAIDDAVQDALLAIHSKRHTWDPARPFLPWLAAVARYKWIDRLRKLGRQGEEPLLDDNLGAVGDHGDAVASAHVLGQLLARLKPAQAAAIRLVKLEGQSIEDAARLTGQGQSLVKVNIHRGLAKLAAMIMDDGDGD